MTARTSRALAGYRWRHFFPLAPNKNIAIPFYIAAPGGGAATESFRVEYTSDGASEYFLQSHIRVTSITGVRIFYDDVEQQNPYGIVGYHLNGQIQVPDEDYVRMTYSTVGHKFVFRTLMNATWHIEPPPVGTKVRFDISNELDTNGFVPIPMQEHLIQGADPIDPTLISVADDAAFPQFQGGYRCTMHLVKKPAHGAVRIAWHKLGFEYRPDMGYFGEDEFTYFLKNAQGQESATGTIKLYVGVNLPPPPEPPPTEG